MTFKKLDSTKQAIAKLTDILGINETYLAGFLGVTEKSLNDWKKLGLGELTPKARRLTRLYEVVAYIKNQHKEIPSSALKSLIENGRITTDPTDPEEGSVSLLNFILEEPEARTWVACVDNVIRDFVSDALKDKEGREASRSVQHA